MTAGGELEEVECVDGRGLDAGNVAEGAHEFFAVCLGIVDDEGPTALAVAASSHLALAGAEFAGLLHFDDVRARTDGFEELSCKLSLDERCGFEDSGVDDQRDLRDGRDAVASGEEEGGNGTGCNC